MESAPHTGFARTQMDSDATRGRARLDEIIDRVLDVLLYVAATFGTIAFIGSVVRWVQRGWHVQHLVHLAVYLAILSGLVAGRRFPRGVRIAILLGPIGLNSVGNLYWGGLAGNGMLFLMAFCILTAVLAGPRAGILGVLASTAVVAALGVSVIAGAIPVPPHPPAQLRSVSDWFAVGSVFVVLAVTVVLAVNAVQQAYLRSADELRTANEDLAREVEERRRIEGELAAREARYRELAEAARDGIFTQDMDLRLTYASPAAVAMLGYEPEVMMRQTMRDWLTPESRARAEESFAQMSRLARQGDVEVPLLELEYVRQDRSTFWGELRVSFLRDVEGNPVGVQGAVRDITDRKRAETERERLQEQLWQADRLQAIGALAGGVAHDFNNQLAGIMGYADLLKVQYGDDPRLREYAERILAPARRASDLTAKLLAFARKGKYVSEPVELHPIIEEVVGILERSISKTIHVRHERASEPSVVLGNATQLQNVILNLALNARDAMPEGGELRITTRIFRYESPRVATASGADPAPDTLHIAVHDTGTGMTPEVQARMFEPFFTTKPPGQGTGMGLAAVYGTVKSHGGSVNVVSTLGQGTTVTISLPLFAGEAQPPTASSEARTVSGTGRVLVVDDEATVREMAARMLERLGYEVVLCDSARDAVDLYQKLWPGIDLVLLDVVLPDMTGQSALQALLRIHPRARVLMFSGHTTDGTAEVLRQDGAVGFLEKPFTLARFSEAIADALSTAA